MRTGVVVTVLGAVLALPAAAAGQDPQVFRFDGGGYDRAAALTTDAAGNSYVAGSAEAKKRGASSFVVVKTGPDGARRWTARYDGSRGGAGGEARAVSVDAAGNVYAAGSISDGAVFGQNLDYLIVKFGPDGTQRWAYRYNGPGNGTDLPSAVVVDEAGNAYVTGSSYGQGFDWATLKFAPGGALLWERRLTGAGFSNDGPAGMVRLPDGSLVVAGVTQNTGDGATNDAEAVAYDPQGAIVWRTRWSDTAASHELIADLDVDASGRVALTGTTAPDASPYVVPVPITLRVDRSGGLLPAIRGDGGTSVDLDPAGNLHLAGVGEDGTPSVAKYDAAGRRLWTASLSRAGRFLANPLVAADSLGAVTVAATARGASFRDGGYQTVRFTPDGGEVWRHEFDGRDDPGQHDDVGALAIDSSDAALVTGTSWNGYGALGGTAKDIVTLRFARGAN